MIRLNEKQISDKISFINNYINAENAATASTMDANANVDSKNIATMEAELWKDANVQINRRLLTDRITNLYDKQTADKYISMLESHEIYTHDETSLKPYCVSLTMYPFLLDGLSTLGGESKAPKHLSSFCGSFVNFVFATSSQFAGAVATVEFLMYFDYFARRDYGDKYLTTSANEIANHLQHVVYAINQPAAARGYQSVFWNISIYDKPYFDAMFSDFKFPDFTSPDWSTVNGLQQFFMKWFNKERTKAVLTYPVVTAACLTDGTTMVDKDFEEFISEELSEGNSFFVFMSENAHALSSCCFSENQKCLSKSSDGVNYMTFKELKKGKHRDIKRNFTIFHNGSWVNGKLVELPKREMYKVVTSNNKEFIISDNHINVTINGEKETQDLLVGDKLLFNSLPLDGLTERDENLTYDDGFVVGAFLGDGSFGAEIKGTIFDINFSMGEDSYQKMQKHIDKVSNIASRLSKPYNNVYPVRVSDKELAAKIIRWTKWERGTYAYNKKLNLDCLLQSKEFREGILDGWYHTDGGNSNRCYTTSPELAEHMEVLITSLGKNSTITVSDRTDEKVVIRNVEYNRNYPLYCVRWYENKNKRSMKNVYTVKNNSIYFDIKSIEKVKYDADNIYCFEMENKDEPYFTLPNGLITHNCRLKNDVSDSINDFSYSLGAGGVSTGSINVITMNINRLVQDAVNHNIPYLNYIKSKVQDLHKFQTAYRSIIQNYVDASMLPVYTAGYISLDKQYLTLGINGLVEAAEYLGLEITDNTNYRDFISSIVTTISNENKVASKLTGFKFNTEMVPAENLGVKNAKWDKKDGYAVPRDCYNSYNYKVEDESVSILEKFEMHGKDFMKGLDGGSAYHCNLDEYPSQEGFKKLLKVAATVGCEYFCFNIRITICNECEHIDKRTNWSCSKCGSKDIDHATRVIGYLKRVSAFSSDRQKEHTLRHYSIEK